MCTEGEQGKEARLAKAAVPQASTAVKQETACARVLIARTTAQFNELAWAIEPAHDID